MKVEVKTMMTERFSIRNEEGKLYVQEDLEQQLREVLRDELCDLDTDDALALGNEYRSHRCDTLLNEFDEDTINDALSGINPWDAIAIGQEIGRWTSDFFFYDGWDFNSTDDVWDGIDEEDLIDDIMNERIRRYDLPTAITAVLDEYEVALERLEEVYEEERNRTRALETLQKYVQLAMDSCDALQLTQITAEIIKIMDNEEVAI